MWASKPFPPICTFIAARVSFSKNVDIMIPLPRKTCPSSPTALGERHKPEHHPGASYMSHPSLSLLPQPVQPTPTPRHMILLSVPWKCKAVVPASSHVPFALIISIIPLHPSPRFIFLEQSDVLNSLAPIPHLFTKPPDHGCN